MGGGGGGEGKRNEREREKEKERRQIIEQRVYTAHQVFPFVFYVPGVVYRSSPSNFP